MSNLMWTFEKGNVFASETGGYRLVVDRAPTGTMFRFQVFKQGLGPSSDTSIATGQCQELREAIGAAEKVAGDARSASN